MSSLRISSHPGGELPAVPNVEELRELAESEGISVVYTPSPDDRKLKAEFWVKAREIIGFSPANGLTLSDACRLVSEPKRLMTAWKKQGFKEWFANGDEQRQRLEYAFEIGVEALLNDVILNPDPKTASAKVNAVKLLAELARKFPRQHPNGGDTKQFGDLSKQELEEILGNSGVRVSIEKRTTVMAPEALDVTVRPPIDSGSVE